MILFSFTKDKNNINFIKYDNNDFYKIAIDKDGITEFDNDAFELIMNSIKYNKNTCTRIKDSSDYEVYLNTYTGYKHYLKNGIEDHFMFLLKNGEDGIMYLRSEKALKKCKKFLIGVLSVEICLASIVNNLFFHSTFDSLRDYNKYNNDKNISYSTTLNVPGFNSDYLTYKINNSKNLTEEEKTTLINKQFFDDILPYYEDSYMKHLINFKSDNIKLNYFNNNYNNTDGFYHPLFFNDLFLLEKYKNIEDVEKKNSVLAHEFIHLMQSPSKYNYLLEGVTVILSQEYYSVKTNSYPRTTENIKLLIDIIGPEPILKACFSGDVRELENILADNLSFEEYKKLTKYLSMTPSDVESNIHDEIKGLLCTLYKNIYKKDITEDENILYNLYYNDNIKVNNNKIYLNKSKMNNEEYNFYSTTIDKDTLVDLGILSKKEGKLIKKYISINEIKDYNGVVYFDSIIDNCYIVNNMIYIYNEFDKVYKEMPVMDAIFSKIIKPYVKEVIPNNEELPQNSMYLGQEYIYYSNHKTLTFEFKDNITVFKTKTKGIMNRFKINKFINNKFQSKKNNI